MEEWSDRSAEDRVVYDLVDDDLCIDDDEVSVGIVEKIDEYTSGPPVDGYIVSERKVGITGDPEDRLRRYGDRYTIMVVVFETESADLMRYIEAALVDHFRERLDNEAPGGGGQLPKDGPYFVDVVLRLEAQRARAGVR